MKLTAYLFDGRDVDIRPAPLERVWMDATAERYAYRCLPLNIANGYGWEILCPSGFKATWDGEPGLDAIRIEPAEGTTAPVTSHFGSGVLTFHVGCLFRTEPGYDLMVQGPVNRPKDAIAPLQGVVETDWAPYTFTMNWLFTQPEIEVEFEKGEPFCHFFPVRRGEVEAFEPELRPLSADADLEADYRHWSAGRRAFNRDLKETGSKAQAERWQKHYYHGRNPDGSQLGPESHRTRMRLKAFARPKPGET
jgi:hypothetical protein